MPKFIDETTKTLFVVKNKDVAPNSLSDNELISVVDELETNEPPRLRRTIRGNGKHYFYHTEGKSAIYLFGSFDMQNESNSDLQEIGQIIYCKK